MFVLVDKYDVSSRSRIFKILDTTDNVIEEISVRQLSNLLEKMI